MTISFSVDDDLNLWLAGILTKIANNVPRDLASIKNICHFSLTQVNNALSVLDELRKKILVNYLDCESDEIYFFKVIKPQFLSKLVYWREIYSIESKRPIGAKKVIQDYLEQKLQEHYYFFVENTEFFSYYRNSQSHLDQQYFLRKNYDLVAWGYFPEFGYDTSFNTAKDEVVAKIMAYEELHLYLDQEIEKLSENLKSSEHPPKKRPLHWSGPKVGLVELIYGLQSSGAFNNGNAEIKQIASFFEESFSVELGNYFNAFSEMRLRKKSRTVFIDQMREKLIQKMDSADERQL
jgi:hypothetical protein